MERFRVRTGAFFCAERFVLVFLAADVVFRPASPAVDARLTVGFRVGVSLEASAEAGFFFGLCAEPVEAVFFLAPVLTDGGRFFFGFGLGAFSSAAPPLSRFFLPLAYWLLRRPRNSFAFSGLFHIGFHTEKYLQCLGASDNLPPSWICRVIIILLIYCFFFPVWRALSRCKPQMCRGE